MTPIISSPETTDITGNLPTKRAGGRRRRRWSREEKANLLAQFAASGATAAQFCREMGLSAATFSMWCRGHSARQSERGPGRFAQVRLAAGSSHLSVATTVIVQLCGGISLSVPVGTDPAWLGHVIRSVREA